MVPVRQRPDYIYSILCTLAHVHISPIIPAMFRILQNASWCNHMDIRGHAMKLLYQKVQNIQRLQRFLSAFQYCSDPLIDSLVPGSLHQCTPSSSGSHRLTTIVTRISRLTTRISTIIAIYFSIDKLCGHMPHAIFNHSNSQVVKGRVPTSNNKGLYM